MIYVRADGNVAGSTNYGGGSSNRSGSSSTYQRTTVSVPQPNVELLLDKLLSEVSEQKRLSEEMFVKLNERLDALSAAGSSAVGNPTTSRSASTIVTTIRSLNEEHIHDIAEKSLSGIFKIWSV